MLATVQLSTPTTPVLAYGATAGSINVSTSSANAPAGQTFTVKACTNAGMTTGCVTSAPITSGTDVGSLAYTPGSAGHELLRDGHRGRLERLPPVVSRRRWPGPQADTSQIGAPGTPVVALVDDHGGRDHRHLHRLARHRPGELHGDGAAPTPR